MLSAKMISALWSSSISAEAKTDKNESNIELGIDEYNLHESGIPLVASVVNSFLIVVVVVVEWISFVVPRIVGQMKSYWEW